MICPVEVSHFGQISERIAPRWLKWEASQGMIQLTRKSLWDLHRECSDRALLPAGFSVKPYFFGDRLEGHEIVPPKGQIFMIGGTVYETLPLRRKQSWLFYLDTRKGMTSSSLPQDIVLQDLLNQLPSHTRSLNEEAIGVIRSRFSEIQEVNHILFKQVFPVYRYLFDWEGRDFPVYNAMDQNTFMRLLARPNDIVVDMVRSWQTAEEINEVINVYVRVMSSLINKYMTDPKWGEISIEAQRNWAESPESPVSLISLETTLAPFKQFIGNSESWTWRMQTRKSY